MRGNELTTWAGVDNVLDRSTIDARVNIPFSFAFSLVSPTTMRRHYKITGPLTTDRTDRLLRSIVRSIFSRPRVRIRPHSNLWKSACVVFLQKKEGEFGAFYPSEKTGAFTGKLEWTKKDWILNSCLRLRSKKRKSETYISPASFGLQSWILAPPAKIAKHWFRATSTQNSRRL